MPTQITQARGTDVSTHRIAWGGVSGAIFWATIVAGVIGALAFATTGWYIKDKTHLGLWDRCTCDRHSDEPDWLKATQAMVTIALIGLIFCLIFAFLYQTVHFLPKAILLLLTLIGSFITGIFMLIGVIVYGTEVEKDMNYSYAFACISCILSFVAGALSVYQFTRSKK